MSEKNFLEIEIDEEEQGYDERTLLDEIRDLRDFAPFYMQVSRSKDWLEGYNYYRDLFTRRVADLIVQIRRGEFGREYPSRNRVRAQLVVFDLPAMTKDGKAELVSWLQTLAKDLKKADQTDYSDDWTARLMK